MTELLIETLKTIVLHQEPNRVQAHHPIRVKQVFATQT